MRSRIASTGARCTNPRPIKICSCFVLFLYISAVFVNPVCATCAACGSGCCCLSYPQFAQCIATYTTDELEYPFGEYGLPENPDKFYKVTEFAYLGIDLMDEFDANTRTEHNKKWVGYTSTPIEALEHCICECDLFADAMYEMIALTRNYTPNYPQCANGMRDGLWKMTKNERLKYTYAGEKITDQDVAYMIDRGATNVEIRGTSLDDIEDRYTTKILEAWNTWMDTCIDDYGNRVYDDVKITKTDTTNVKLRLHNLYKMSKTGKKYLETTGKYIYDNYDKMMQDELRILMRERAADAVQNTTIRGDLDENWVYNTAGYQIGYEDGYGLGVSGLGLEKLPSPHDIATDVDYHNDGANCQSFISGYYDGTTTGVSAGTLVGIREYLQHMNERDAKEEGRAWTAFAFHVWSMLLDIAKIIAIIYAPGAGKAAVVGAEALGKIANLSHGGRGGEIQAY